MLQHPEPVHAIALTPVANLLLAAVGDGAVHLWHLDWEPEETAPGSWEETARPFLETYVSRVRGGHTGATERMTVSDADVSGLLADLHRRGFGGLTAETVRPRLEKLASTPDDAPSYWETLRRNAPAAVRAVPREAVSAVRRFPWGRAALGVVLLAGVLIGVRSWFEPEATVALSPHMEQIGARRDRSHRPRALLRELRSPRPTSGTCRRSSPGTPEAGDVACVAALSDAPDRRRDPRPGAPDSRRGAGGPSLPPQRRFRPRRGPARGPRRSLRPARRSQPGRPRGRGNGPRRPRRRRGAAACVADILAGGSPLARGAAVFPFRHHLARGLIGVDEGWTLVQELLGRPGSRGADRRPRAASMYTARVSEPLARPLLEDPDPGRHRGRAAGPRPRSGIHRTDLLRGNVERLGALSRWSLDPLRFPSGRLPRGHDQHASVSSIRPRSPPRRSPPLALSASLGAPPRRPRTGRTPRSSGSTRRPPTPS